MAGSRHLFPSHGVNGKGDCDRTTDNSAFRRNMAEIQMPGVVMERAGPGRLVKRYGPAAYPTLNTLRINAGHRTS